MCDGVNANRSAVTRTTVGSCEKLAGEVKAITSAAHTSTPPRRRVTQGGNVHLCRGSLFTTILHARLAGRDNGAAPGVLRGATPLEPPAQADVECIDAAEERAAIANDRIVDLHDHVGIRIVGGAEHPGGAIELLERQHAGRHPELRVEVLVADEGADVVA